MLFSTVVSPQLLNSNKCRGVFIIVNPPFPWKWAHVEREHSFTSDHTSSMEGQSMASPALNHESSADVQNNKPKGLKFYGSAF